MLTNAMLAVVLALASGDGSSIGPNFSYGGGGTVGPIYCPTDGGGSGSDCGNGAPCQEGGGGGGGGAGGSGGGGGGAGGQGVSEERCKRHREGGIL